VLPQVAGDVLQVGCGTGFLNKFWSQRRDVRLTNMDCNLHALRLGVQLNRFSDYVHASIDKPTPLADETFDTIIFGRSFHHVRNHKKALRECHRLLRPGGQLIIADPVTLENRQGTPTDGYMANSSLDGVIWRFSEDSFVRHLQACLPPGLSIAEISTTRLRHITNYNLFVPHTDLVAVVRKEERPPCVTE
jgi:SAM-dependent methyltransferase